MNRSIAVLLLCSVVGCDNSGPSVRTLARPAAEQHATKQREHKRVNSIIDAPITKWEIHVDGYGSWPYKMGDGTYAEAHKHVFKITLCSGQSHFSFDAFPKRFVYPDEPLMIIKTLDDRRVLFTGSWSAEEVECEVVPVGDTDDTP